MKLVALLTTAVVALVAAQAIVGASTAERADYGDAPDGRPTGYGPQGEFPSLLDSDGARAFQTNYALLGKDATRELDSLQVDQDRRDDGVFVRLVPCQMSEAFVLVTLSATERPVRRRGFLNLFFDWNRDGRWAGADGRCSGAAPREWAVSNAPVKLSAQSAREQLYRVRFRAGSFVGPMWFRAVLSVDERVGNERGRGGFAWGEVEDSLYGQEVDGAVFDCFGDVIKHGKSGFVDVFMLGGPNDRILSAQLLVTPAVTPERIIDREATVSPDGQVASFKYTSRKPDVRQKPVVVDTVQILVRARVGGKLVQTNGSCDVIVQHASAPASAPPGSAPPGGGATGGSSSRLGWYSGPAANFGAIDFRVDKAGAGKIVRKLQFTSRITCTKGVTSHHVHVDGTFPVKVAGGRETFTGRSTAFDVGQPIGRPPGTFTINGAYTGSGGRWNGTLRLMYTHQDLGSCDTGSVTWQAPAAQRPTHTHP